MVIYVLLEVHISHPKDKEMDLTEKMLLPTQKRLLFTASMDCLMIWRIVHLWVQKPMRSTVRIVGSRISFQAYSN